MKCDNCRYLYYPEYESSYTACLVFGDEIPDKYARKDDEGCICTGKQLAKMCEENEEIFANNCRAFVEWALANENSGGEE